MIPRLFNELVGSGAIVDIENKCILLEEPAVTQTLAVSMRQLKHLLVSLIGTIFIACENSEPSSPMVLNDTTKIIKLALQTAFEEMTMPSIYDTKINFLFGDSVMLTADTTLIEFLSQSIDTIKFKILDEETILSLINRNKNQRKTPNYLRFRMAEKTDSSYFVVLSSLSGIDYGAGGTMGLGISKKGDSLLINHKSFVNIN